MNHTTGATSAPATAANALRPAIAVASNTAAAVNPASTTAAEANSAGTATLARTQSDTKGLHTIRKFKLVYYVKNDPKKTPCFEFPFGIGVTSDEDLPQKELNSLVQRVVNSFKGQKVCTAHEDTQHDWMLVERQLVKPTPRPKMNPNPADFVKIFKLYDSQFTLERLKDFNEKSLVSIAMTIFLVYPFKCCGNAMVLYRVLTDANSASTSKHKISETFHNYFQDCNIPEADIKNLMALLSHVLDVEDGLKYDYNLYAPDPTHPFLEALKKDFLGLLNRIWEKSFDNIQMLSAKFISFKSLMISPQLTHDSKIIDLEILHMEKAIALIQSVLDCKPELMKAHNSGTASEAITSSNKVATLAKQVIDLEAYYEAMSRQNGRPVDGTQQGDEKLRESFYVLQKASLAFLESLDRDVQRFLNEHKKEIASSNFTMKEVISALEILKARLDKRITNEVDSAAKAVSGAAAQHPLVDKFVSTLETSLKVLEDSVLPHFQKLYLTDKQVLRFVSNSQMQLIVRLMKIISNIQNSAGNEISDFPTYTQVARLSFVGGEDECNEWVDGMPRKSNDADSGDRIVITTIRIFQGLDLSLKYALQFLECYPKTSKPKAITSTSITAASPATAASISAATAKEDK